MIHRIQRDVIEEIGADAFEENYGSKPQVWVQRLTEQDFDPTTAQTSER